MNSIGSSDPGTAEHPYPRVGYAWSVVALLLLAYTVALLDRQILSLMVQPIRADLGISDTEISLLAGFAFVLFYSTMGLVLGRVADRHNRRNMIIAGMVLWCTATVACGLSRSYSELFLARMMVGFGEATLGPAAYSMIADYFAPRRRAQATGVYTMGVFMGTGAAMIFGGAAIAATSSAGVLTVPIVGMIRPWQAAFLIVGLPGLLVAALMLAVREPVRRDVGKAGGSISDLLVFVRGNARALTLILGGFGMNGLINYGITTWVPTLFIRRFGWTAPQIGSAYGLILLTWGSAGVIAGGWWVSRPMQAGRRGYVLLTARNALAFAIPLLLVAGLSASPWVSLAAVAGLAFIIGVPAGLAPVALYEITPNQFRGQVIAFYLLSVTLLGLGIGVTLIAAVNDFLFRDEMAIGSSISLVLVLAAAIGVAALHIARRPVNA
jgi:MFS family permease